MQFRIPLSEPERHEQRRRQTDVNRHYLERVVRQCIEPRQTFDVRDAASDMLSPLMRVSDVFLWTRLACRRVPFCIPRVYYGALLHRVQNDVSRQRVATASMSVVGTPWALWMLHVEYFLEELWGRCCTDLRGWDLPMRLEARTDNGNVFVRRDY